MADRALLHRSNLDAFCNWLQQDGFAMEPTKGQYEVLRARKPGKPPVIVYTRADDDSEHLTILDRDTRLVRQFIKLQRKGGPHASPAR